jgi:ubiquinone/menaquinone biosynthesis C-methylase UbiE
MNAPPGVLSKRARWRETLLLLRLFVSGRSDVGGYYDLLGEHNNLCEHSLYNNLGYWQDAITYDDACEALVKLSGERLDLPAGARLLDAGCGFADQDMFWARHLGCGEIEAINISASQVGVATRRVREAGLDDRVRIVQADAIRLPYADASFDGVISIEAAMHFNTRERFFHEAARVLKPGGRIVLADSVPPTRPESWPWLLRRISRAIWRSIQIPAENMYPPDEYARRMAAAGFDDIRLQPIQDQVYPGYTACVARSLRQPAIRRRVNPLILFLWRLTATSDQDKANRYGGYYLVSATRRR